MFLFALLLLTRYTLKCQSFRIRILNNLKKNYIFSFFQNLNYGTLQLLEVLQRVTVIVITITVIVMLAVITTFMVLSLAAKAAALHNGYMHLFSCSFVCLLPETCDCGAAAAQ